MKFQDYNKGTLTKKVWYLCKDISIHQWSPETDPQLNHQFVFNTTAKAIQ